MKEIWKPILGYEENYSISNLGRIKFHSDGHISEGNFNKGYKYIGLRKNGIRTYFKVHRLVAEAFIPNPEKKPFIDHIDTDRANNCVNNLRWVTSKENTKNPLTFNKIKKELLKLNIKNIGNTYNKGNIGIKSSLHKKVRCIETGKIYYGTRECARELGYTYQGANCRISEVCRGIKSSFHGLHFEYVE